MSSTAKEEQIADLLNMLRRKVLVRADLAERTKVLRQLAQVHDEEWGADLKEHEDALLYEMDSSLDRLRQDDTQCDTTIKNINEALNLFHNKNKDALWTRVRDKAHEFSTRYEALLLNEIKKGMADQANKTPLERLKFYDTTHKKMRSRTWIDPNARFVRDDVCVRGIREMASLNIDTGKTKRDFLLKCSEKLKKIGTPEAMNLHNTLCLEIEHLSQKLGIYRV